MKYDATKIYTDDEMLEMWLEGEQVSWHDNDRNRALAEAKKPVQCDGAKYKSVPALYQRNIDGLLAVTPMFEKYTLASKAYKETAITHLSGAKSKLRIDMELIAGAMRYTLRIGNKIIIRTSSKNTAANNIAGYYIDQAAELGGRL